MAHPLASPSQLFQHVNNAGAREFAPSDRQQTAFAVAVGSSAWGQTGADRPRQHRWCDGKIGSGFVGLA